MSCYLSGIPCVLPRDLRSENVSASPCTALSPTIPNSLHILRCPLTGSPLELLSADRIDHINQDIRLGLWSHADPNIPPAPVTSGLCTHEGDIVYRIDDDIVCLLPQMAIRSRSAPVATPDLRLELKIVQAFYNEFGWVKNSKGLFNDTTAFTETRLCARRYQLRCNERILALLDHGEFLLDVASGAIPHPEYREQSRHYRTRICVDFSIRALREARAQIGDHGLFILGNITRLPLAPDTIDAVISLHTVYHLPSEEQIKACDELLRVARPLAPVLVVYVWSTSPLMNLIEFIRRLPRHTRRVLRRFRRHPSAPPAAPEASSSTRPALFFHPCDHTWFAAQIANRHSVALRVWSAVTSEFQSRFFTDNRCGRLLSYLVMAIEDAFPRWCGRMGQYPIWRFSKPAPPPCAAAWPRCSKSAPASTRS